jgi:hypothetical protein
MKLNNRIPIADGRGKETAQGSVNALYSEFFFSAQ